MGEFPVIFVLNTDPPGDFFESLAEQGRSVLRCDGRQAASTVKPGQLLVCDRVPGWQALIARAEAAGGISILVGERPRPDELPHLLPLDLEIVSDFHEVTQAIDRAGKRIVALLSQGGSTNRSLVERAESAERVSRFAQSIATQLDLPHVMDEAMKRARELCEADGASLLLIDHQTGELYFDTVSGGAGGTLERVRLQPGQGVAGRCASRATSILVSDTSTNTEVDRTFDQQSGFNTASIIAVPLIRGGDVIGVIEAVRGVKSEPFSAALLRRLEDLAPHVTIAVHNAQMTSQLRASQAQVLGANAELERKVGERTEQIARAKREWEQTFDAIAEPIALMDGFVVRRANQAYARRVGKAITEVPGQLCHKLFAGRDQPCEGCPLLNRGDKLSGEVKIDNATFAISAFQLSSSTAERALVVHYRDVSGQRTLEHRLRETERMAALGQLASGAAHEINNPLGFLTSNLRSLKSHLEELSELNKDLGDAAHTLIEDGMEMINESLEGARRVADIVRGLRELAKLEIGRCEPVPVNPSVTRAVRAEFGAETTKVEVVLGSKAPVAVPPLQLDQVIGHILRNAHQAVGANGHVRIRSEDAEAGVQIVIEDEGSGIPKENLGRIFEPFFTTRGVGKGIGLGLTAAYGIVKRYGGDIHVWSTVGKGSVFTVQLPRAEAATVPAQPAA
ncbi:MAG: ATP-binding protein [Myxococcaceae bacterium]